MQTSIYGAKSDIKQFVKTLPIKSVLSVSVYTKFCINILLLFVHFPLTIIKALLKVFDE